MGALVILGLALGLGSLSIWQLDPTAAWQVIWTLRLPRVLAALVVGACLALAGGVFQGMLQNPLADPYILGVSSGAALGACLGLLTGLVGVGVWAIPMATFMGAGLTILLITLMMRWTKGRVVHLILSGIMLNAFFSALTLILLYVADNKIRGLMMWFMGDLSTVGYGVLSVCGVLAVMVIGVLLRFGGTLNILAMGDDFAQSEGVRVKSMRRLLFALASILTAISVTCGGVIGFVGLIIPHIVRLILGDDFRVVLPVSVFAGALFLVGADLVARVIIPGVELPIGIMTSLIGAPFFMVLLSKSAE